MKNFELLTFPHFEDDRGETIPFELDEKFPFPVKRVYVITGNAEAVRGGHAHLVEEEVFVAVSGSVTVLVNDGSGDQEIALDQKNKALYVQKDCWHEFWNFSPDCVLLCFSSTHYFPGEENYVMEKEAFLST